MNINPDAIQLSNLARFMAMKLVDDYKLMKQLQQLAQDLNAASLFPNDATVIAGVDDGAPSITNADMRAFANIFTTYINYFENTSNANLNTVKKIVIR